MDELDARAGQPVDVAPWGYSWRADRVVQSAPEAYLIPRRLARIDKVYRTAAAALPPDQLKSIFYTMPDLHKAFPPAPNARLSAGLLWTGRLSKYQVELHWPEGAEVPAADAVEARVYPTSFGWFGWTVDHVLNEPKISADRRNWTYVLDTPAEKMDSAYNARVDAATEMVAVFCDSPAVPTIALTSAEVGNWKRIDVEVEGDGVTDGFETYMALAGPATKLTAPRQGFSVQLLYAPDARPGLDSRLTIRTKAGRFTIRLRDLDDGPISVARFGGVSITSPAGGQTKPPLDPLRAMTRKHPEAESWQQLMRNVRLWNCPPGTKVPATLPAVDDPPMTVEISADPHWTDAWRAACGQLRGKHMWGGLAFEVGRVAHEMELVGLHDEAARVYDHFLPAPGAKSDGDYTDGDGALELAASMRHDIGFSHDGTHASTGRLLFAMAERYFLTGDKAWFEQHRARLQKAADWIIRQRRSYLKEAPNRADLLAAGLMPPQMLGDYALPSCDWHFYYCDDAFSLQGLSRFADALAEIDPAAAKPHRDEADAFRKDVRAAMAREAELSPLRRGRDGAFHSFLPRMAYTRGLTGPEIGAPQFPDCDFFMGALPLAEPFAALDANDSVMVDTLDLMDEMGTAAFSPPNQAAKKQKNLPADDAWFWTAYSRLPKASHNANIYLVQDDVPSFLRFWMNEYAVMVGANGKFWESWAPDNFNDCTNADNGTAGWFVENFRDLLVMEDNQTLWLARATPRAWLEQGKSIRVKNAPTYFGPAGYEIVSDVDHNTIRATIDVPERKAAESIVLRLRHPKGTSLHDVTVDGRMWEEIDSTKETITLKNVSGRVEVTANYAPTKPAAASAPSTQAFYDWAPTPPMGWNSWDCFGGAATEAAVLANADYMAKHLKSHGWDTIVIDGRWCRPDPDNKNKMEGMDLAMDENGRLRPAPNRFPSSRESRSFKPLADAIHAKGLKFGLHILRGVPRQAVKKNVPVLGMPDVHAADIADTSSICSWSDDTFGLDMSKPAAQAYYDSVFALLASWEIDFIKVDDLAKPYKAKDVEAIRRAIDKTGRRIVFSTSAGPLPPDGVAHVPGYVNMWRMSGDFWDVWRQLKGHFAGLAEWADRRVPRGYADGDMLPIGSLRLERPNPPGGHWTRFTHDEQITLMTLWSIARSPLFMGGNLPDNDDWTLSVLTNDEVLAVDQRSEGNRQFFRDGDRVGWTARVPDSKNVYVALFNASNAASEISAKLSDAGLTAGRCEVRDLWSHRDLDPVSDTLAATIPPHGAVLYRLSPR